MNLRITSYIQFDPEVQEFKELENLVEKFVAVLDTSGYGNDVSAQDNVLKSLVIAKENVEINDMGANEFFANEMQNSLLTVVPAVQMTIEKELVNDRSNTADSED